MTIKKAVFPVAGIGSRFLPATKSIPKEMLPIVDKPLIHYATDEALQAGINSLIFVNGKNKHAIEDYFDRDRELEDRLKKANKKALLEKISNIMPSDSSFIYLRQPDPLGLGNAVSCARPALGKEAFAVLLADDFIEGKGVLKHLIEIYEEYQCCVLAIKEVPHDQVGKYGVIDGERITDGLFQVKNMVEKPSIKDAPSNYAVVGRYILTSGVLDVLRTTPIGTGGEIQLTDAIIEYIQQGGRVLAYQFSEAHYDCGNKQGYFEANLHVARSHPEIDFSG